MAWQDGRFTGQAAIAFSRSTDGGADWSTPIRIDQTPGGAPAFMPGVHPFSVARGVVRGHVQPERGSCTWRRLHPRVAVVFHHVRGSPPPSRHCAHGWLNVAACLISRCTRPAAAVAGSPSLCGSPGTVIRAGGAAWRTYPLRPVLRRRSLRKCSARDCRPSSAIARDWRLSAYWQSPSPQAAAPRSPAG